MAFETLKKALVTAPVLAFPQFDKPFILAVDASDESIGYVLSQLDADNREHPVAYGGRALRNEELRWHITDKEGLSLVEAIRQFRPYLANQSGSQGSESSRNHLTSASFRGVIITVL